MKVFISLGLRGREPEDIQVDIARATANIRNKYGDDVQIVHNADCVPPSDTSERLYCLGEAIKKLGDCDACYFVNGCVRHNGCLIETHVCRLYNIPMIKEWDV